MTRPALIQPPHRLVRVWHRHLAEPLSATPKVVCWTLRDWEDFFCREAIGMTGKPCFVGGSQSLKSCKCDNSPDGRGFRFAFRAKWAARGSSFCPSVLFSSCGHFPWTIHRVLGRLEPLIPRHAHASAQASEGECHVLCIHACNAARRHARYAAAGEYDRRCGR